MCRPEPADRGNHSRARTVRDNSRWLIRVFTGYTPASGPAVRIVTRLFSGPLPDDDGYVDWWSRFARHS